MTTLVGTIVVLAALVWFFSILALLIVGNNEKKAILILLVGVISGSMLAFATAPSMKLSTYAMLIIVNFIPVAIWFIQRDRH